MKKVSISIEQPLRPQEATTCWPQVPRARAEGGRGSLHEEGLNPTPQRQRSCCMAVRCCRLDNISWRHSQAQNPLHQVLWTYVRAQTLADRMQTSGRSRARGSGGVQSHLCVVLTHLQCHISGLIARHSLTPADSFPCARLHADAGIKHERVLRRMKPGCRRTALLENTGSHLQSSQPL